MERVSVAWERGDYDRLRTLLHPAGSWYLVTEHPRTITDPDELVEAIRHAKQDTVYDFQPMRYVALSDYVPLGLCYIRTPLAGGSGHQIGRYVFLLEVRDELFYRSECFRTDDEAMAAFEAGWQRDGEHVH